MAKKAESVKDTVVKDTAAKDTAAKTKEPEVKLVLQYRDYDIEQSVLYNKARAVIGDKFESVKNLNLYVKPEEGKGIFCCR